MNLCPSYIHLQAGKNKNSYPEKFDLIADERIAHIRAIRTNTPHLVSARLLVCQNQKDQPQNYCHVLCDPQAEMKLCESNKTNYVYFYVDKVQDEALVNKLRVSPVYFMAFVRAPGIDTEIPEIAAEVKRTAEWFGIAGSVVQCYIFYYSTSPLCNTLDLGAYKEKFDKQRPDSSYFFQFRFIPPPDEKPWWLYVNGGLPRFTIEVQKTDNQGQQ